MSESFRESSIGDFQIQTHGDGDPAIMCIGGLAYAPSDYVRLATLLDGTTHVVNHPLHTGAIEYIEGWQQRLHDAYANLCQSLHIDFLAGHSGGSFDALAVASTIKLQGIIMLAPAFQNPGTGIVKDGRTGTDDPELTLIDRALESLCEGLPDDLYMSLLKAHFEEYGHRGKKIYKQEMPSLLAMCSRILDVMRHCRNPILVIVGEKDPWFRGIVLPEHEDHISIMKVPDTSHFLHVGKAVETAIGVNAWTRDVMDRAVAATKDDTLTRVQPREAAMG